MIIIVLWKYIIVILAIPWMAFVKITLIRPSASSSGQINILLGVYRDFLL